MKRPPIALEGVTFLNPTALESGLLIFKDKIDESKGISIGSILVREVGMGYYITSYALQEQAEIDYTAFQELYTEIGKTKIIPKPVTVFEYKGMFHIALSVEEKVDKSKGLDGVEYQGFIIHPAVYIQLKKTGDSVVENIL